MGTTNISEKYTLAMRVIHWLMAIIIIGTLSSGLYMTNLPSDDPSKFSFYPIHKSFGVLVGLLVILRLIARFTSKVPPLPTNINHTESILTKIGTFLLYLCMIAMPVSGYIMSGASGREVLFFGILVPNIVTQAQELAIFSRKIHGIVGYCAPIFILGHIGYAFKHLIFDKVNLFRRIW